MSLGYPEEKPITLSQGTTAFVPPQLELPPGMTWETVREKSKEKAPEFAQVESKKIKYTFEPVHLPLPPGVEESEQAKKRRQERPVVFALKPISEIKAWKPPTVEPLAPVPVVPAPVVPIPVPAPVVKPKTGTGTLVHMKPNTTPQEFRDIVMSNKPVFIKYTAECMHTCFF